MTPKSKNEQLIELEQKLMSPEVRKSPEALKAHLHPLFFEFGTLGRFISFEEVLHRLPQETHEPFNASNFAARELSADVMQVTFQTERKTDNGIIRSLRSSIWKKEDSGWQMIFHQGTRITD